MKIKIIFAYPPPLSRKYQKILLFILERDFFSERLHMTRNRRVMKERSHSARGDSFIAY